MARAVVARVASSALSSATREQRPYIAPVAATQAQASSTAAAVQRDTTRVQNSFAFSDSLGTRVRVGLQTDGSYGIRVWNSSGALIHNFTTT